MKHFSILSAVFVAVSALAACSDSGTTLDALDGSSSGASSSSSGGETSSSSGGTSSGGGETSSSSGAGAGSSSGEVVPFSCPAGTTETLVRIVAGNISDGGPQNYNDGSGLRIFKGLAPDIALVQEMNLRTNSPADLAAFVDEGFGPGYSYTRGGGGIPNGIVSRYPITDEGERPDPMVTDRTLVWARIDVPGDRDIVAISVHWHTEPEKREPQVEATLALVSETSGANDLVVLGGDFNTKYRDAAGVARTSTRFVTTGPYPADEAGNENTSLPRSRPYDWVVAQPSMHERGRPFTLGSLAFPNGLVFDSRLFSDLSLTPGVLATDSNTHQHMAVARSFAVCE